MSIVERLHRAAKNYMVRAEIESYETATLGKLDASETPIYDVTGRPGFVWIVKDNGTVTIALNDGAVPLNYGLRVLVRDEGAGYLEIARKDKARSALPSSSGSEYGIPAHPLPSHSDVPAYTGHGGKLVAVNVAENAVEYVVVADTVAAAIDGATAKTTPVDADTVGLVDSAASNALKKLSWANIKATLKTYFDTLYTAINTAVLLTGDQTVAGIKTFTDNILAQSNFLLERSDASNPVIRSRTTSTSNAAEMRSLSDAVDMRFISYGSAVAGTRGGQAFAGMGEFLVASGNRFLITAFPNIPIHFLTNAVVRQTITGGGDIGHGVTSPQGWEHAHDGTSGKLFVTKTGVDGTAQTIIPNGTGDVTKSFIGFSVITAGVDTVVNTFTVASGANRDVAVGGSYTMRFALNVNGELTCFRLSGSGTATLTLFGIWQ